MKKLMFFFMLSFMFYGCSKNNKYVGTWERDMGILGTETMKLYPDGNVIVKFSEINDVVYGKWEVKGDSLYNKVAKESRGNDVNYRILEINKDEMVLTIGETTYQFKKVEDL